ncbi:hypothetical protein PC9H_007284 [Pleurotus ostreatus]|uniref:Uncharacterized protein n=1 Tax=Pleurotus ostreatus TaxID=5322 RepID=A0A8H6ZQT6_PLEOS|nr:uncharacterized protein PC9H_007284 [Pleurotus ostreatus]KAF7428065.1 hypothetical protein PC9H_007284 [Pleurotus ostreatus]
MFYGYFTTKRFDAKHLPKKWLGILPTAEKLKIQRIQTLTVGKLAKMEPPNVDPIARIAVQQRYDMDMTWAKDAFMDVVQRTEPLTEEEAIDIGTFATVTQSPILWEMLSTNSSISLPDVTSSMHFSIFDMEAKPMQLPAMGRIAGLFKTDAVIELTTERMKDTMIDIEQVKAIDLH